MLSQSVATAASAGGASTTLASSILFRPFGPLGSLTYGNGLKLSHSFSQNYKLTRMTITGAAASTLDLSVASDNAYSTTKITDNAATGRGASFAYTPSGRLQSATGPWGAYAYAWDGAGNLVQRNLTVGGTTTYANEQVSEGSSNTLNGTRDQNGATTRTLYYGAGGNLVNDIRVGGSSYTYVYNHRKRLVAVQVGGAYVGTYGYDATGARVWRQVTGPSTVDTQYVYDRGGHLLAEHDGSTGAVVKEYVWIDDMPLAVVDYSSGVAKTYYIHTGPVNEPLVMTDVNMNEVWNAYMEPFGMATVFGASSAALDLRLPGQWLTAETGGLNQNGFRDYDPTLGRYIEPDPTGLSAGQNSYAYVDGDPLNKQDPFGLNQLEDPTDTPFNKAMQQASPMYCDFFPGAQSCMNKMQICMEAVCRRHDCHGHRW